MSSSIISHKKLTDTLALTEDRNGFWLYDSTRGMNLAMQAKTPEDAFVKALTYYQKRLLEVESSYKSLREHVDTFVSVFVDEAEE